jgi:hypothetical protein
MRTKTTLEPQIIQYLQSNGDSHIDDLIRFLHKETAVPEGKIEFRIAKMISQNKLTLNGKIVSLSESSKNRLNHKSDEVLKYGPITIRRKGRYVFFSPNIQKEHFEKILHNANNILPKLKSDVSQGFKEIEKSIIDRFDPLDVLAYISAYNLMADPETYSESSFKGKQLFPEIIQNVILKNRLDVYKLKGDPEDIPQIGKLLDALYPKLIWSIVYETMLRQDITQAEKDVLFYVTNHFLIVRGAAYPQHYKEISVELFSKINDVLKRKNFTIEEYWSSVQEIDRQINDNYNRPIKTLLEEHKRFIEFSKEEVMKGTNPEEIMDRFRKELSSSRRENFESMIKLTDICRKGSFQIQINDRTNQELLKLLSMTFGDNEQWGSPLHKSDVAIKPIIRVDDKYYCFLNGHLIRNVIQIIESILTEKEKAEIQYSHLKGRYFEEKALKLLEKITNGKTYSQLRYPKGNEIDGIIVMDDSVFLVEIKGKKKRIIAGVDDILWVTKEDFEAHINDAFEQTRKALAYIQSEEEVEFKDEKGNTVLRLAKDAFKKFYLVNVCVEDFSKLAIDLNLVKSWNPEFIKGNQYPWVVNIYDLIVLSDLLESEPKIFIRYLDQRIQLAMNSRLQAIDELDLLGYFFENGHLEIDKNQKSAKGIFISGYGEEIDRWYSYLRGEVTSAKKPTFKKP